MIEKAIYRNHLGEEFLFDENGAFLNAGGLRDYSWTVSKKNNRISTLDNGVIQKKLTVMIIAPNEARGIEIRNQLFEIVEKDVLAMEKGRIIVGDYYLKCFVSASSKSEYLKSERCMRVNLTIQTDAPFWIKESQHSFYSKLTALDYEYLDYNFDYPIDYWISSRNPRVLRNSGFTDTNFKLVFYGECVNPKVIIGGHLYQVNITVDSGERVVVDSEEKTVVLIDRNRKETNIFNKRNRDSYIFKKIPAGLVAMSFDETFDFDIILKEERSEPKWT